MSSKPIWYVMVILLVLHLFGCSNSSREEMEKPESNENSQLENNVAYDSVTNDYLFIAECNDNIVVSGVQEGYGLGQYIEDIKNYSREDFDYYSYSKIGFLRKGDKFFVYDEYNHGGEMWYRIGNYAWIKCESTELRKIEDYDISVGKPDLFFSKLPTSGIEEYPDDHYYGMFVPEDRCDFELYENEDIILIRKNNFSDPVNVEFRNIPSVASIPNFAYAFPFDGIHETDGTERYNLTSKNITNIEYDELGRVISFLSCNNYPWGNGEIDPTLEVEYNGNIAFISSFVKSELHGNSYYYYTCRFNDDGLIIEEYNKGLFKCDVFFNY